MARLDGDYDYDLDFEFDTPDSTSRDYRTRDPFDSTTPTSDISIFNSRSESGSFGVAQSVGSSSWDESPMSANYLDSPLILGFGGQGLSGSSVFGVEAVKATDRMDIQSASADPASLGMGMGVGALRTPYSSAVALPPAAGGAPDMSMTMPGFGVRGAGGMYNAGSHHHEPQRTSPLTREQPLATSDDDDDDIVIVKQEPGEDPAPTSGDASQAHDPQSRAYREAQRLLNAVTKSLRDQNKQGGAQGVKTAAAAQGQKNTQGRSASADKAVSSKKVPGPLVPPSARSQARSQSSKSPPQLAQRLAPSQSPPTKQVSIHGDVSGRAGNAMFLVEMAKMSAHMGHVPGGANPGHGHPAPERRDSGMTSPDEDDDDQLRSIDEGHVGSLGMYNENVGPMVMEEEEQDEEPLYVNAKQYHRILKRRSARARLEELRRVVRERKVSLVIPPTYTHLLILGCDFSLISTNLATSMLVRGLVDLEEDS